MAKTLKKVTSVEVAKRAGVSRSAVSRAFSDHASVAPETREKVIKAANELGYRVNKLASSLTNKRSDLVGIVASNMDNPFRASQIEALSRELMKRKLQPILLVVEKDEDPSTVIGLLLEYNVSGVIMTSDTPPQSICEECIALGVPMVLVNKAESDARVDRVILDNEKSGVLAAQELYNQGCKNLGIVSVTKPSYSLNVRVESFIKECKKLGVENIDVFVGEHQDYAGGQQAGQQFLSDEQSQIYDGVFCVSDYIALGFIDALRLGSNLTIGEQLKLVGCDNIAQASWPIYNMTTIHQDTNTLAEQVVQALTERVALPNAPENLKVINVELVKRGSTDYAV